MSQLLLRSFTNPEALRTFEPVRLLTFLRPYADFFRSRGVKLPEASNANETDLDRLAEVMMTPSADTPADLVNALHHITELATTEAADVLMRAARDEGISIESPSDASAADIALQMWMADPDLVCRKHAEHQTERRQTFAAFFATGAVEPRWRPKRQFLSRFTKAASEWFDMRRRGRGLKVFLHEYNEEVRFIVRRGGLYQREGSLDEGKPGSVHFRPMRFDVLILDRATGELRINAESDPAMRMYRVNLGLFLFGDREFFAEKCERYNLDPIRRLGRMCLACGDVPGIQRVVLKSVTIARDNPYGRRSSERGDDVFAALELDGDENLLTEHVLLSASFKVFFANSKRSRTVTIRPPNIAHYERRDDGPVIERWLIARGFARIGPRRKAHEPLASG
ncbi:MAG: hypothetical protein IT436_13415 [Phycisphaerales bacterium]|nr:hypothetical protein [Phycisphaerales bacterium]